ncbi:MAG: mechanosensitive ion channel family protein [Alphaproteobacteria bacterium]
MIDFYHFYKNAVSGNHLFEWLVIIACFIATLAVEIFFRKFKPLIESLIAKYREKYNFQYIDIRSLSLLISIVFFLCGTIVSYYISGNYENLLRILKVTFLLLVYTISNEKFIKNNFHLKIISLLVISPIILNILGLLDLIISDLDLIGFDIGKNRFSILLLVKAVYIASILFWIGKYLSKAGENSIKKQSEWNINTKIILLKFFNIFLYIALAIIGLNLLGFDFTTLTLFSGAFVFALTLSLQKIASNFLSGIILLFEKAIKVDDLIELQTGVRGKVKYLGARTTIIDAQDGSEITVPNEDIINSKIISYIEKKTHPVQLQIKLNLDLDNDPEKICELLIKATKYHSKVLPSHEITCKIEGFYKHNLIYDLTCWTLNEHKDQVKTEVISDIWKIFTENNMKFSSE